MSLAADRPGATAAPRAVTLRIKRGAKVLSEVRIGRVRVTIGGGSTSQLRLKNAGLADECVVLDTRSEPFGIESRLGPDEIRVNGKPILSSLVHFGDVIELSGLAIEVVETGSARKSEPPAPSPVAPPHAAVAPLPDDPIDGRAGGERRMADPAPIDPYMGKKTAAAVKQAEIERARQLLQKQKTSGEGVPVPTPGRPVVPAAPVEARPPWIELVGDDSVSEARLVLRHGAVAGRQGDLRIRHPSVSKRHAQFVADASGQLFIEDLGSTNGVWINRERVSGRNPLRDGDTLHLGAVEFTVRIPSASVEATTSGPPLREPSAARVLSDPRERATERDRSGVQRASERAIRTEGDGIPVQGPVVRSPFADDDLDRALTGTGAPGRRDRTENEIGLSRREKTDRGLPAAAGGNGDFAAATHVSAAEEDLPASARRDTDREAPSPMRAFEVEDLSERFARAEPAPRPAAPIRPPEREKSGRVAVGVGVRTTVQPRNPVFATDPVEDFVPRRSGGGAGLFVAILFLLVVGGGAGVGGLYYWPQIRERLGLVPATETARTDAPIAGATPAGGARKPGTGEGRSVSSGKRPGGAGVASARPAGDPVALPAGEDAGEVGIEGGIEDGEQPMSIFEDAPLDLRGDGRLDEAVASLERDTAEKGLRAERAIGAHELKSIFLSEGNAIVRRLYSEDGFEHAPSAADDDPRDAEARRLGAKQIDTNRVNALIRAQFPAVKRCLVGSSVKRGEARVVVEFTIQPNGKVENASVIDSDISGSSFQRCVTGVVRGIKFPKPKEQSVVVQFPFVFTYN